MFNGNLFSTIIFLAAFVACVVGVYRFPLVKKALNAFEWIILSVTITLCYGALVGGILDILTLPINLYTMAFVYAVAGVFLTLLCKQKKESQLHQWETFDVVAGVLITIGVWAVTLLIFTPSLRYAYFNSDAGLHLKEATDVVFNQRLFGMYFIHLHNAMIIEVISPFIDTVDLYKGYVLADCLFLWFETLFFFVMIRRFVTTKLSKVISLALVFVYFMGYPFMSFYFSFVYWALGGMLVGFVLLALRLYEENEIDRRYTIFMLMLGCFGVMTCYMLFAPATFLAVFIYLMIIAKREGRVFTLKNIFLALKIFLIPTLLGGYFCLYGFFISSGTAISDALSNAGGIYTELYMDFFWTLFPVFFLLMYYLRKKKITPNLVFFLTFFAFTGGMLFLTLIHKVSTYYYYKTYFPLWILCWLLTAEAIMIMLKEHKETLMAYGMLILMFLALNFGRIEYKCVTSTEKITGALHSPAYFTLFTNNWSFITRPHNGQDETKLDLYEYVLDNLKGEKMVPLMTETNDYGETYFYEGVSGFDFPDFYEWRHSEEKLAQAYIDWEVHYTVLLKGSDFDNQHGDELLKREDISIVYETDAGYILYLKDPAAWGNSTLK